MVMIPFIPKDLAILVAKDLRLFARDPAQIIQFVLYFGMLGFYLFMLPRIVKDYLEVEIFKKSIALLNLTAISWPSQRSPVALFTRCFRLRGGGHGFLPWPPGLRRASSLASSSLPSSSDSPWQLAWSISLAINLNYPTTPLPINA